MAAYRNVGVVLLRGILDLKAVNTARRCIDDAVQTLGDSASGYDLTELAQAYQQQDAEIIAGRGSGQHDVPTIMDHMRSTGKPLLLDPAHGNRQGKFLLDTGVTSRLREFRQFAIRGAGPEIAAALQGSTSVRFYGDQIFVEEPGTCERTAFHQDATYFEIEGDQCCVLRVTQEELEGRLGMATESISHIERGVVAPGLTHPLAGC